LIPAQLPSGKSRRAAPLLDLQGLDKGRNPGSAHLTYAHVIAHFAELRAASGLHWDAVFN
jgi:hypothetical protein